MAKLPGDWPINASTTSGNDLADKLNRLVDGTPDFSGGTFTGPVILAADPLVALGAATKQYVDARDAALQTGVDQAKADAATAANAKVSKTGDVMSGALRVESPDGNVIFGTYNGQPAFGTNYSRYQVTVSPNSVQIGAYHGGAGGSRNLELVAGSVLRINIHTNGVIQFYNHQGVETMRLDADGNLAVRGNITAFQPL